MSQLIGICGYKGHGKSTVARLLCEYHNFTELSFASILKTCVAEIFGWDRARLDSDLPEDRLWKETPDAWWCERLSIDHLTPRFALQNIGTEVMRTYFHPDIWVAALERRLMKLLSQGVNVVISDVRLPNERQLIEKLGGHMMRMNRDAVPMQDAHVTERLFLEFQNVFDLYNNDAVNNLHDELTRFFNSK